MAVAVISLIIIYLMVWRTDAPGHGSVIDGDGKDYYSYLVSVFITHDLGHQDTSQWYITQTPTGTINIHTIGVAMMLLPFFAIACMWAYFKGVPVNGFSYPFEMMISIGALVYVLIGLFFLHRFLQLFNVKKRTASLMVLLVFFGTNLIHYSLIEPTMSHVYSFSLIAAFLYYAKRLFDQPLPRYTIISAMLLGLITLIRPANILVVLALPLLSENFSTFLQTLRQIVIRNYRSFIVAAFLFASVFFLQAIVWFTQNGRFIQWTYRNNGFYFLHPRMLKMLFGFNGGFFIYTPVFLLFFIGIISWYRTNRFQALAMFFFTLFLFYFLSSYCAYTYNDGLSIRPLCDFYSLLVIPGAMLFNTAMGALVKTLVFSLSFFALFINLIYCYQYKTGILQASGMNYRKWSYVFLHTGEKYRNILGGCDDLQPYSTVPVSPAFSNDSSGVITVNDSVPFTNLFVRQQLGFNTNKIFVTIKMKVKEICAGASRNASLLIKTWSPKNKTENVQTFRIDDVPFDQCCSWNEEEYTVMMTGNMNSDDQFVVLALNQNGQQFALSDFHIDVFNYNYQQK
jgi:hypothetical protein